MVFYNFILVSGLVLFIKADPYYPLGPTGTVPRAYDMFRAFEGMEGR
jgi:hypothetical protein